MRRLSSRLLASIFPLFVATACGDAQDRKPLPAISTPATVPKAVQAVAGDGPTPALELDYLKYVTRTLSSDGMGGRRPGTPGGKKAVKFIIEQMQAGGLEPAGENGKWTQRVPMRSVVTLSDSVDLQLAFKGRQIPVEFGPDIVGSTFADAGAHQLKAPLVFLGHGVTAPEYDWDDYAGVDVKGKIVLVLVGDPPVGDERFGGEAMTYYGRWTYKYERALEAGAAGCLVIHEPEPASYGWNVVHNSWSRDRFHVIEPGGELPQALPFQGWISQETAEKIAVLEKTTLSEWHARASKPGFKGEPLTTTLEGSFTTAESRIEDVNVVARLPGGARADETVLITAHWDHLGTADPSPDKAEADLIFNGAVDNASGIAGMLGVAAALKAHDKPALRSVIFLATTAEEQGLLGAKYFAGHPTVPLDKIVAVANIDSMNVTGRTKNIQVVGMGQSTLEDTLGEVAQKQGRVLVPDERPEAGGYYRSDHFAFARRGVPAIYFRGGKDMEEGGRERGEVLAEERARRYHTVDDEFDASWSFEGALQDAVTLAALVRAVADAEAAPTWKPGSEFARVR